MIDFASLAVLHDLPHGESLARRYDREGLQRSLVCPKGNSSVNCSVRCNVTVISCYILMTVPGGRMSPDDSCRGGRLPHQLLAIFARPRTGDSLTGRATYKYKMQRPTMTSDRLWRRLVPVRVFNQISRKKTILMPQPFVTRCELDNHTCEAPGAPRTRSAPAGYAGHRVCTTPPLRLARGDHFRVGCGGDPASRLPRPLSLVRPSKKLVRCSPSSSSSA